MATDVNEKQEATKQRDVIARLADRGEEALQRIGDIPGGSRALKAFNDMKTRVDELNKKVRGIDALEARLAKLEKDVSTLKRAAKGQAPAPKKPSASRKPAA